MESPEPKPRPRPRISLLSLLLLTALAACGIVITMQIRELSPLREEVTHLRNEMGQLTSKNNYLRGRDGEIVEKAVRGYVQVLGLPAESRYAPSSRRWEWVIDVTDDFVAEICFGHYLPTDWTELRKSIFRQALEKGPHRIAVEVYVDPSARPNDQIGWKFVVLVDEQAIYESIENQRMLAELKENRSTMSGEVQSFQKVGNYVELFKCLPSSVGQGVKVWIDTASSNSPLPTPPPPR